MGYLRSYNTQTSKKGGGGICSRILQLKRVNSYYGYKVSIWILKSDKLTSNTIFIGKNDVKMITIHEIIYCLFNFI